MKYLALVLILSGCATSNWLYERAERSCRYVSKQDAEQLVCIHSYIRKACDERALDVKICGKDINERLK